MLGIVTGWLARRNRLCQAALGAPLGKVALASAATRALSSAVGLSARERAELMAGGVRSAQR